METKKNNFLSLIDARVHLGHSKSYWNPDMKKYIHSERNRVHIINLHHTQNALDKASKKLSVIASKNGKVLFVGTKPHISETVKKYAVSCAQFYVTHKWLGGMLTNWRTISQSIKKMEKQGASLDEMSYYETKKEKQIKQRRLKRSSLFLEGIREMNGLPSVIIVFDTFYESIAVSEANKMKIPIIGIVDTNCNPNLVQYPVPGNDDSRYSIELYCKVFTSAIIQGLSKYHKIDDSSLAKESCDDETSMNDESHESDNVSLETELSHTKSEDNDINVKV